MRFSLAVLSLLVAGGLPFVAGEQSILKPAKPALMEPGANAAPCKAQAQAIGREGPLELTLELLNTDIPQIEPLYYRISLKNIGTEEITVVDDYFRNHGAISGNIRNRKKTQLEMLGPDGKALRPSPRLKSATGYAAPPDPCPGGARLDPNEADDPALASLDLPYYAPLASGEAVSTRKERGPKGRSPKRPTGDFVRLPVYALISTGTYKVRAIYDQTYLRGLRPVGSDSPIPEEKLVRVETPWIEFRVSSR